MGMSPDRLPKYAIKRNALGRYMFAAGVVFATEKMLVDGGARVLVTGRSEGGLESARERPRGVERCPFVVGH